MKCTSKPKFNSNSIPKFPPRDHLALGRVKLSERSFLCTPTAWPASCWMAAGLLLLLTADAQVQMKMSLFGRKKKFFLPFSFELRCPLSVKSLSLIHSAFFPFLCLLLYLIPIFFSLAFILAPSIALPRVSLFYFFSFLLSLSFIPSSLTNVMTLSLNQ